MHTQITNKHYNHARNTNEKGLTLLEVALAMLIFGLIITPLVMLYNINFAQQQLNTTRGNFNHVRDNVNIFITLNNRYPKPSPLNLGPDDTGFGEEFPFPLACIDDVSTCNADFICPGNIATDGPPVNGVCITNTPGAPVLIGAVPFNTLGIDQIRTLDAWSNKIFYAVSARQTETSLFQDSGNGVILLQGLSPVISPPTAVPLSLYTNMDLVLVSTGPNGLGGFTANGALIGQCVDPLNPTHEDQNCNFTNTFMAEINFESVPESGSRTLVEGTAFYDDLTLEQRNVPLQIWNQNRTSPDVVISAANRIGVQEPDPDTALHVRGDVASERLVSNQVCDEAGSCFNPVIIAGANNNMHCAMTSLTGLQPVIEIGNQRVFCAQPVNTALQPILGQINSDGATSGAFVFPPVLSGLPTITDRVCGAGHLVSGIDALGEPICTATP